jgi:hypothetical protein
LWLGSISAHLLSRLMRRQLSSRLMIFEDVPRDRVGLAIITLPKSRCDSHALSEVTHPQTKPHGHAISRFLIGMSACS